MPPATPLRHTLFAATLRRRPPSLPPADFRRFCPPDFMLLTAQSVRGLPAARPATA